MTAAEKEKEKEARDLEDIKASCSSSSSDGVVYGLLAGFEA